MRWPRPAVHVAWPAAYCAWAAIAIALSVARAGLSAENVTRLLVVAFLAVQVVARERLARAFPGLRPRTRFVGLGTLLAAVVEGVHMISTPVFAALRVDRSTTPAQAMLNYGLDLAFTVPAYLVIFTVMWACIARWRFTTWRYILVMGLAQALGDGGLFFFAASPFMLLFLPYPMTNYHAINVVPYLAVRAHLPAARHAQGAYLAIPAVIATYLACGAAIKMVGRVFGFA